MQRILTLLFLAAMATSLSSCLEEKITTETPEVDGYSGPNSLLFNEREMAVLSADLTIDSRVETPVVTVPSHIGRSSGLNELATTDSDARKALLGRVLFYDKQLSATGETSCATCHEQDKAFADGKAFSDGINGAVTKRNSIALGSVPTFAPQISGYGASGDEQTAAVEGRVKFFWDERAGTVKEQSEATIQDEIEMGRDLHELSSDLRTQEMYKILTMKAFGTTDLTPDRITLALEKFTSSITSMNTPFDRFMDGGASTGQQRQGFELFMNNCASCHGPNLGEPAIAVANNGLDLDYADKGVGGISGSVFDNGVFKVPFLRNVALTGPYMHDGRFETLDEVIDHYSEGIQDHRNLHPNLKNPNTHEPRRMNFTESQKQALIAFLKMGTDQNVLTDARLADPFRR
ncbi:MAG: cytochrome c peroxidase [Bacteroidota bacterium]